MRHYGTYVDELLSEVDDFYPDHPTLQAIWDHYEEWGYINNKMIKKLERMRDQAYAAA